MASDEDNATDAKPLVEEQEEDESDVESDVELEGDSDEIVESDVEIEEPDNDPPQKMGDPSVEVTDENRNASQEAKKLATEAVSQGKLEEAIERLTEAVTLNPKSAIMYATRASVYIKMKKPNAAFRDATAALAINPDYAKGYKTRGMAREMLGKWEEAAEDLHVASGIDCDEELNAVLKEVEAKVHMIKEHRRKLCQDGRLDLVEQTILGIADNTEAMRNLSIIIKGWKGAATDFPGLFDLLLSLKKKQKKKKTKLFLMKLLVTNIVTEMITEKSYDQALLLVKAPFQQDDLRCTLLELELVLHFYKGSGSKNCIDVINELGKFDSDMVHPETHYIFGEFLFLQQRYDDARSCIDEGIVKAQNKVMKNLVNDFQHLKNLLPAKLEGMKDKEVPPVKEELEAEPVKEEVGDRKDEEIPVKAEVEAEPVKEEVEAQEIHGKEQIEEIETTDKEIETTDTPPSTPPSISKVDCTFSADIVTERESTSICHVGTVTYFGITFRKSFIIAENDQIQHIHDLIKLCSTHCSFLRIDNPFQDKFGRVVLLTEEVDNVEVYFCRKFGPMASGKEWWNSIKIDFWIIFRDVMKGLIHLFLDKKACGHLSFNIYVTVEGRGRILPSCIHSATHIDDFNHLSRLMTGILGLSKVADDSFLPKGLRSFLHHIQTVTAKTLLKASIPAEFLLDHPYFWSVEEKIGFAPKLHLFRKSSANYIPNLESALESLSLYNKWFVNLDGLYSEVYRNAAAHSNKKGDYGHRLDIVRYIYAVYFHINQPEYDYLRKHKKLSLEEIEENLMSYFPNYYTNMFECLCRCALTSGPLNNLMEVSTVNMKAHDATATMVDATKSDTT